LGEGRWSGQSGNERETERAQRVGERGTREKRKGEKQRLACMDCAIDQASSDLKETAVDRPKIKRVYYVPTKRERGFDIPDLQLKS
jgi:hypothetical protein